MKSIIVERLKSKVDELKSEGVDNISITNFLKEELQYYILNYIFRSKEYSSWVMYGGSVLRICYELPRMSEDLDFQIAKDFNEVGFKKGLENYFLKDYGLKVEVTMKIRNHSDTKMFVVKFDILKEFNINIKWTILKVMIDVNIFDKTDTFINESISKSKDDLVFSIKTYPLSTLMSSKIAAFLLRNKRGIAGKIASCKPRDVYELMWYMEKKIVPDLEYLLAKNIKFDSFLDFRDAMKIKVLKLEDNLFKDDLAQFFFRTSEFGNWYKNWRERFIMLINSYDFYKVDELTEISVMHDFKTESMNYRYKFSLEDSPEYVYFFVTLSSYWFDFSDIRIRPGNKISKIKSSINAIGDYKIREYDLEYIGLFYTKIVNYLSKVKKVVSQKRFKTKLIRATANDLNVKKQIYLDRRLIKKIQFEELL